MIHVFSSHPLKQEFVGKNSDFTASVKHWFEYYLSSSAEMGNAKTGNHLSENITISGRTGIKHTFDYEFEEYQVLGRAVWIYLPVNREYLLSVKYSSKVGKDIDLSVYEKIISTLKFDKTAGI